MPIKIDTRRNRPQNNPTNVAHSQQRTPSGSNWISFTAVLDIATNEDKVDQHIPFQGVINLVTHFDMNAVQQLFDDEDIDTMLIDLTRSAIPGNYDIIITSNPLQNITIDLFIESTALSSYKNEHDAVGLLYDYTIRIHPTYVLDTTTADTLLVHIPQEMERILRKYCTREHFQSEFLDRLTTLGLPQYGSIQFLVDESAPSPATSNVLSLPVHIYPHMPTDSIKMREMLVKLEFAQPETARLLHRVRNTMSRPDGRANVMLLQGEERHIYKVVDVADKKGPLAPCFVDIEENIRQAQAWGKSTAKHFAEYILNNRRWIVESQVPLIMTQDKDTILEKASAYDKMQADKILKNQEKQYTPQNGAISLSKALYNLVKGFLCATDPTIQMAMSHVAPFATWDYKKYGDHGIFIDFGNYHYGVIMAAAGVSLEDSLLGAGLAQLLVDLSKTEISSSLHIKFNITGDRKYYYEQRNDYDMIICGYKEYLNGQAASKYSVGNNNYCTAIDFRHCPLEKIELASEDLYRWLLKHGQYQKAYKQQHEVEFYLRVGNVE